MAEIELVSCEVCGADADVESCTLMCEGGWLCRKCKADADAAFHACDHEWQPDNRDGEDGQFCMRCSHFVALDAFEALFGHPAAPNQDRPDV